MVVETRVTQNQTRNLTTLHREWIFRANQLVNAGPQKNQAIVGRATVRSIERSFITQRFAICSCKKFSHIQFYLPGCWDSQQLRRSRHIIDALHNVLKTWFWGYASDVDVPVQLIARRNLLSCRNVYFGVSAVKTLTVEYLGSEPENDFWHSIASLARNSWEISSFQGVMDKIISTN